MKHSMTAILGVILAVTFTSCMEAKRTCSGEEMVKLKEGGFSVEQINGMCMRYVMNESATRTILDSVTKFGKAALEANNGGSSNGSNKTTAN
jgi:hypothetical protein